MAQNSNWATIEGGVTNTFPLSINRETYWTALRKGECDYQDMTTRDYRGVFSYGTKPSASPEFFIKDFRFKEDITDTATQTEAVFHWGRWWRINPTTKYRLEYSRLDLDEPSFAPDTSGQEWKEFLSLIESSNKLNAEIDEGVEDCLRENDKLKGKYIILFVFQGKAVLKVFDAIFSLNAWITSNGDFPTDAQTINKDDFESEDLWEFWVSYKGLAPSSTAASVSTTKLLNGPNDLSAFAGPWGSFLYNRCYRDQTNRASTWWNDNYPTFPSLLLKFNSYVNQVLDGRKWRYTKYEIIPFSQATEGYIDFINDSKEPIRLLAFNGVGQLYVLKQTCGYVVSNAHFGPSEWRRTTPNYSIGTEYTGSGVTNAIIDGAVAVAFRDRSQPGLAPRHYLWNGQDFGLELTGDVRKLSDPATTYAEVNWPSRLIIFGPLVYELDEKRIFYYSGKTKASLTTRPYFAANFNAQTLRRIAFICDGNAGSFDAIVEYGQSFQNLQKTRSFKVKVNNNTKNRFRHLWLLDIPVTCRVWRLKIENMTGIGITQIDADVSFVDSPDLPDGTE